MLWYHVTCRSKSASDIKIRKIQAVIKQSPCVESCTGHLKIMLVGTVLGYATMMSYISHVNKILILIYLHIYFYI